MAKKAVAKTPTLAQSRARLVTAVRRSKADVLEVASADTGISTDDLGAGFDLLLEMMAQPEVEQAVVEAFKEDGARAARKAIPGDKVLDAYLSLNWAIWEQAVRTPRVPQPVVLDLANRLMRGIDAAIGGLTRGFIDVEVELAAEHSQRRRSILEELLTASRATPQDRSRIRARAERHGLGADASYRIILIRALDQLDEAAEDSIDRLERSIRMPVPHHRAQPGILLPLVLEWRGRALVLAESEWRGGLRLVSAVRRIAADEWVAVDSGAVDGIEPLADALARAEYAVGIAASLGRKGWIGDPGNLALETTFLLDEPLTASVIDQHLGAILADARMGEELIETLEVYLGSRQNIRETARRLHLATRTVAYRLERIETLLGSSLDGETSARVGAALLALRVTRQAGRERPARIDEAGLVARPDDRE